MKPRPSVTKRQREQTKRDRQLQKAERRAQRKAGVLPSSQDADEQDQAAQS